ncbi:MAG: ribonuclease P protein component [Armatimonadetes bacterium]|nr:ribonuclease P protein component [Armatimonadota bacterium]
MRDTLRRQTDFDRVYRCGRRFRHKLLGVVVGPAAGTTTRAAYVVGRRVSPLAVVRNRVRRRLREAFRALRPSLSGLHDIIIIAYQPAAEAPFRDLAGALQHLLRTAGIIHDEVGGPS